jgi:hypothetical protein
MKQTIAEKYIGQNNILVTVLQKWSKMMFVIVTANLIDTVNNNVCSIYY